MWIAVAILGVIAIATGITILPGGHPNSKPDQTAPAPATPAPPSTPAAPPAAGATSTK